MLHASRHKGQAALIVVLLSMTVMLSAVLGATSLALKISRVANLDTKSRFAFFTAESGVDDAVYRIKRQKNLASSFVTTLNESSATTEIVSTAESRDIISGGISGNAERAVSANLTNNSVGVEFFYGVQVGAGGLHMENNAVIIGNVFSNGSIDGGEITGDAIVAGGLADNPSVEWTTQNTDQFFASAPTNRDIAQSFIANANGALTKVSVYLAKTGNPASSITIRLVSDDNGNPSQTSLASGAIAPSTVGITASWIDATFSSPPTLVNGTKYWIVLDYGSNSSSNYWNWRKDSGDAYINNTGKYTSNWSSGSAIWTNTNGDLAFKIWIGGTITQISNIIIDGTGRANTFVNANIGGSPCPNPSCIIDNPVQQTLPISDGVIQDFREAGLAGETCAPPLCDISGNLTITGSQSVGPIKVPGNLTVINGGSLTMTGTIWVAGNVNLSNNCSVRLTSDYGSNSGVIVSDGIIEVSNNCVFAGSGSLESYVMLLSAKNALTSDVIEVSNNAIGVIFYASNGRIHFSNNAGAKEATAYGIDLDNNATVAYESGLANINFSSGPSGGWTINSWQEIRPP